MNITLVGGRNRHCRKAYNFDDVVLRRMGSGIFAWCRTAWQHLDYTEEEVCFFTEMSYSHMRIQVKTSN